MQLNRIRSASLTNLDVQLFTKTLLPKPKLFLKLKRKTAKNIKRPVIIFKSIKHQRKNIWMIFKNHIFWVFTLWLNKYNNIPHGNDVKYVLWILDMALLINNPDRSLNNYHISEGYKKSATYLKYENNSSRHTSW